MNAGKTTTLLQSSYNYQERGISTRLFLPDFDDRGGVGTISSRIGLKAKAFPFSKDVNFFNKIATEKEEDPTLGCVLVDEAHFLSKDQVYQLAQVADELNIPVLTYGLRTDFQAEPFEGSQYLLALAEEIQEIKTICYCGKKATMNLRIDQEGYAVKEGDQVEIGGNDRYVALCRRHFKYHRDNRVAVKLHDVKMAA